MLRNMTLAAGVFAAAALFGIANAAPLAPGASPTAADASILVPAKVKKGSKVVKGKGGKGHAHRHRHRHGRDVGIGIGLGIFGAILCAESGDC
jgi:hypothetical protein